jgi:hypothetical protein
VKEYIMRKFILAFASLAIGPAAMAQQALQCANPDVLNSLAFNARSDARVVVTRAMPASDAGFRAPADFTLIGSGVRGNNVSTVVAYRTSLDAARAYDSLLAFMSSEGWRREIQQGAQPQVTIPQEPILAASLCREGERRNLLVQEIEGVRYATISGAETLPPRACNAPRPEQAFSGNPMGAFNAAMALMPQFTFPDTARMSGGAGPGTTNNNARGASTTVRIESPDPAATLAGNLAAQLARQGWSKDAEWNGAVSTGSTWTRKAEDGKPFTGMLQFISVGKGLYEVGFTVSSGG